MASGFDYDEAFSRNIGWVTTEEQQILRRRRVAIAGMGGVGGGHLLALARLGIGAFTIADFDVFDIVNFNRQAGAMMSTRGREKADVLAEMARDINPEIELSSFPERCLCGEPGGVPGRSRPLRRRLGFLCLRSPASDIHGVRASRHPGHNCGTAGDGRRVSRIPARKNVVRRLFQTGRMQ